MWVGRWAGGVGGLAGGRGVVDFHRNASMKASSSGVCSPSAVPRGTLGGRSKSTIKTSLSSVHSLNALCSLLSSNTMISPSTCRRTCGSRAPVATWGVFEGQEKEREAGAVRPLFRRQLLQLFDGELTYICIIAGATLVCSTANRVVGSRLLSSGPYTVGKPRTLSTTPILHDRR